MTLSLSASLHSKGVVFRSTWMWHALYMYQLNILLCDSYKLNGHKYKCAGNFFGDDMSDLPVTWIVPLPEPVTWIVPLPEPVTWIVPLPEYRRRNTY